MATQRWLTSPRRIWIARSTQPTTCAMLPRMKNGTRAGGALLPFSRFGACCTMYGTKSAENRLKNTPNMSPLRKIRLTPTTPSVPSLPSHAANVAGKPTSTRAKPKNPIRFTGV